MKRLILTTIAALVAVAGGNARAESMPDVSQVIRYVSAMTGSEVPQDIARMAEPARNISALPAEFEDDIEMLQTVRGAYPDLSGEELMMKLREFRLSAIVDFNSGLRSE